jgi:glycine oxidase
MSADILVVGQGIAGTLLAWALEQADLPFEIADAGHARAASSVAAGMINPITGRRLVKSSGVDDLLPVAREVYRELERALETDLCRDMRVRRLFADAREQRVLVEKQARSELAPFVGEVDEAGFWIEGAARINVGVLLAAARERFRRKRVLREETVDVGIEGSRYTLVVDCTGVTGSCDRLFDFVPWRYSKGEILEISVEGLDPNTILNCGQWVLPVADGMAWVGATHEPGVLDYEPTASGRVKLEVSARKLLHRPFEVTGHRVGVRVNLPDKQPVVGRHPLQKRYGLFNGLGAKGALLAPALARQWANHIADGGAFSPEFDVARFAVNL